MQTILECLDILRSRVSAPVRGLIICTFWCGIKSEEPKIHGYEGQITIAIDCAMGTRLFPIALNFLATTFIAGPSHSAPLLHGKRLLRF
jgi:hypothetical protein